MVMSLDELSSNLSKPETALLYHLVLEQRETNRLLTQLFDGKPAKEAEAVDIDELKRPELMKRISKTKAPQGWQKWSNDKLIAYLKGES
jgi:hypothetical protein